MVKRGSDGRFGRTEVASVIEDLMSYRPVQIWISGLASGKNRYQAVWHLSKVLCEGVTVEDILSKPVSEVKAHVRGVASQWASDEKYSVAKHIQVAVQSFLQANGVDFKWLRKEVYRIPSKRIVYEVIPPILDVYRMADAAGAHSKRNKAIILTLWQSGVRVNALCRITVGMVMDQLFPDIKTPVYLKITRVIDTKLSGYGLGYYYTFLDKEAAEAVREYLDVRVEREGQIPSDDSPLFISEAGVAAGVVKAGLPTSPAAVHKVVKRAARWASLDSKGIWPHVLRKSFRKVLNRSSIDEDTKETLMGHKLPGSRGNYFDVHDVDEVAEKYAQADFSRGGALSVNGLRREMEELRRENTELTRKVERQKDRDEKIGRVIKIFDELEKRGLIDKLTQDLK